MRVLHKLKALLCNRDKSVILNILLQIMQEKSLVEDGAPETDVMILAGPEKRQFVVLVGLDHGIGNARKDGGQVLQLEVFRQRLDELDDKGHVLPSVIALLGMQAVVARPAVVLGIILSEIVEQHLAPALAGLCIRHSLLQELLADFLLGHRLPLHELLQLLDILVAVIGDALAFLAVTAGTARLLIIAFDALGNVVVDDKANVRLVNAHAKSDGGHDDVNLFREEQVLVLGPGLCVQAGMIRTRLDAVDGEHLGQFLHLAAAEAVDDAALAGILADEADDILLGFHLVPYLIIEVGPIEGGLEYLGVLDAQVLENVALDLGRSGSREGNHRRRLNLVYDVADLAVFRAEVMAPLGNTVGFIHRIEGDFDRF